MSWRGCGSWRRIARIEIVEISSPGDEVTDVPLVDLVARGHANGGAGRDLWNTAGVPGTGTEGTGFFTATLERALLDGAWMSRFTATRTCRSR